MVRLGRLRVVLGDVDLALLGPCDQEVTVRAVRKVDPRLGDIEILAVRNVDRRDVRHEEVREPIGGHVVGGAEYRPESVGVDEPLVHPP